MIESAAAASCGLGSAPDRRARRAYPHLQSSCAAPFGPALLVSQDPRQAWCTLSHVDAARGELVAGPPCLPWRAGEGVGSLRCFSNAVVTAWPHVARSQAGH